MGHQVLKDLRESPTFFGIRSPQAAPAQAQAALGAAIEMYRAMDMAFWLPHAEAALAQIGGAETPLA